MESIEAGADGVLSGHVGENPLDFQVATAGPGAAGLRGGKKSRVFNKIQGCNQQLHRGRFPLKMRQLTAMARVAVNTVETRPRAGGSPAAAGEALRGNPGRDAGGTLEAGGGGCAGDPVCGVPAGFAGQTGGCTAGAEGVFGRSSGCNRHCDLPAEGVRRAL